jgi:hypothetical protein
MNLLTFLKVQRGWLWFTLTCMHLTTYLYFWKYFLITFLLKIQKTNAVFVSDTRIYNWRIKQVRASTSGTSLCRPCKVLVLDKRCYCEHAHNALLLVSNVQVFTSYKYCDHTANRHLLTQVYEIYLINI